MNEVKLYSVDEAAQSSAAARTVQLSEGVHTVMACNGKWWRSRIPICISIPPQAN